MLKLLLSSIVHFHLETTRTRITKWYLQGDSVSRSKTFTIDETMTDVESICLERGEYKFSLSDFWGYYKITSDSGLSSELTFASESAFAKWRSYKHTGNGICSSQNADNHAFWIEGSTGCPFIDSF